MKVGRIVGLGSLLILASWIAPPSGGAIPRLIGFGGVLTDKAGQPVDGTFEITFRLYAEATGGTALWEEKQTATVDDGVYNILLGNVKPLNLSFDKDLWLAIEVQGGSEMTPRFRLGSVVYAFRAETAETLQGKTPADFAPASHAHADLAKASDLSGSGTINTAGNPVDWTKLNGVPAGLADGADNDTTYSAGSGLLLAGTTFSLLGSCTLNDILKWNGSTWACAADAGGSYTAGTGLSLLGGSFSVNFAGTGTAVTASRSNHDHDAAYVNAGTPGEITLAMLPTGIDAGTLGGVAAASYLTTTAGDSRYLQLTGGTISGAVTLGGDLSFSGGQASGLRVQNASSAPTSPLSGQLWFDTSASGGSLKVYNTGPSGWRPAAGYVGASTLPASSNSVTITLAAGVVGADSAIFLTVQDSNWSISVLPIKVSSRVAGTSFTVSTLDGTNATNPIPFKYLIVN